VAATNTKRATTSSVLDAGGTAFARRYADATERTNGTITTSARTPRASQGRPSQRFVPLERDVFIDDAAPETPTSHSSVSCRSRDGFRQLLIGGTTPELDPDLSDTVRTLACR
jgi:hypothetical protein